MIDYDSRMITLRRPNVQMSKTVTVVVFAISLLLASPCQAKADEPLTVFAAASLKEVLEKTSDVWVSKSGTKIRLSFAASSTLARQIQAGAPADIFISANIDWMDQLDTDGLLVASSRIDLAGNELVLISANGFDREIDLNSSSLDKALGNERLAMALVDAVPAGIYGKQALRTLGLWKSVQPKIAQTDNVRAALNLVLRGETPLGIVYATDATTSDAISVAATFPNTSHEPIRYPAGLIAESTHPKGPSYLAFLSSEEARKIFTDFGFKRADQ